MIVSRKFMFRSAVNVALLALLLLPDSVFACAACYGQSDSPMAKGLNWGILSLLGVVVPVLGGIVSFFFFIAKKASMASKLPGTDC